MRLTKAIGIPTALVLSGLVFATTASAGTAPQSSGAAPQSSVTAQHGTTEKAQAEHGMGFRLDAPPKGLKAPASAPSKAALNDIAPIKRTAAAPESYDLTEFAVPPGDQGKVGSCVAWATGYSGYGILMNEQKIANGPMAPMFTYAQIAKGNDRGTWASVALPMQKDQGIDTKAHYWQGDFDYTTQPDRAERANAAKYKLSGFTKLPTEGSSAKTAIKDSISRGMPVPIGFEVHKSFQKLNSTTAGNYSYLPGSDSADPAIGGHEVTIIGYNSKGVKIENSWGTGWGANGYFTVPWKFFDIGDVNEAHAMGKLVKS
ncbi:C1 family peptidase [Streptomyces zagrosensis]|uniref:C1A family cysteine protease n=1 Tax=Streptomyces zagrosensis TaxID=1042984 RepID=A0A7W9UW40_9ACTN|nr:C1 family peptidase [Streptomyces zagrosensis]MBB5933137.1 C1A family cysteine protease [Streptomyces zagrosensis]